MPRTRHIVAVATAGTVALAVVAPAAAATTTIRRGSATAAAYSGAVRASLLGTISVATSLGNGSCNSSTMNGSVASNGTGLTIASAVFSWTPTPPGPNCQGALTSVITSQNTPWTGGNVTYAPVAGGRDATVTIANFRVKAVVNFLGSITCYYGGTLVANGFNPTNPARPVPGTAEAQAGINGAVINKISAGSNILCPANATVTGTYALKGEVTAGSGVFNQTLFVTS